MEKGFQYSIIRGIGIALIIAPFFQMTQWQWWSLIFGMNIVFTFLPPKETQE